MSEHVLNYHLGDNASFHFENATYVGLSVTLPIRIFQVTPAPTPLLLTIRTSNLETLSPKQAHSVLLDGFEIGQLADTGTGNTEVHEITIPREFVRANQPQRLVVEVVGRLPSLEDDFVLRSLKLTGADLRLGWV